jgi:uncharacterized protein
MPGTAELQALVEKVDAFARRAEDGQARWLQCKRGCDGCCRTRRTAWAVEIHRLTEYVATLGPERDDLVARRADPQVVGGERCVFLDADGGCAVYPVRPILCRTHGPAAVTSEGDLVWCGLNFAELDPETVLDHIPADSVLQLNTLETLLALINQRFVAARPGVAVRAPLDAALDR